MRKYEILVVDDDPLILQSIGPYLENRGYNVITADNGKVAVEMVTKSNFDLVLTDMAMEPMNGMDVLMAVREVNPDTMVIILTGYADMASAIVAFRLGVDDYIPKPCEIEEMHFRVERCLEKLEMKKRVKKAEEALRESEERFKLAMEANRDGLWDWNVNTGEVYYSPAYKALLGYATSEVPAHISSWKSLMHPEDKAAAIKANFDCIENRCDNFEVEFRMQAKNGEWRWILGQGKAVIRDDDGRAIRMVGTHTDITERKRVDAALRESKNKMERRVKERTAELSMVNEKLESKTINLEEKNTALKVLLEKRDEDKIELEKKVISNVRKLILPYLEKLNKSRLNVSQKILINIIESNLDEIISPFAEKLSSRAMNLTPAEIKVADLIKQGKTSKEMADFLNLSYKTIERHRENIRQKLGLKHTKINLQSHLLSFR